MDILVWRSIEAATFGCILVEKSEHDYQELRDCKLELERKLSTDIYGEMLRGLENCSDKDYVKAQVQQFLDGKQNPSNVPKDGCPGAWWNEKDKVKEVTQKKSKAIGEFIRTNFPNFDYLVIVYQGHYKDSEYRGCNTCPDIIKDE